MERRCPEGDGGPAVGSATADGVVTITINRPRRRNALDDATWVALERALTAVGHDPAARVLVLTGAGGHFCAGADISTAPAERHPLRRMWSHNEVALRLREITIPTIAKVSGAAVGAGWNLALGCDLVIADTTARFSQIFTSRGLSPDLGGTWFLPRLVGMQQAKRLALLAEVIDTAEAERLGLVTQVVEAGELDGVVAGLARRLAAAPPVALALTKRLLDENVDRPLREALESEAWAQAVNFAGVDPAEGYASFRERRVPRFTGEWAL
ncbi:enoyl-CoA hydratase/carnithine racemase [Frankia sp. EI5c]|uniref:enoyl-CoA hydratase/isomerase family protein n=1 Tax=Frankia sp. EI5c TaxID=683316 RepID=UPI0007C330BE|nr:enoyl-CoA hydratase-related protein [Frankia sp. EI5c]OAA27446.1 enoyl-CoA hydratase/carnithine racemase [Frankia sp. EI5c]